MLPWPQCIFTLSQKLSWGHTKILEWSECLIHFKNPPYPLGQVWFLDFEGKQGEHSLLPYALDMDEI